MNTPAYERIISFLIPILSHLPALMDVLVGSCVEDFDYR